jgi:DNA-binding transcriptional LysR family regulator
MKRPINDASLRLLRIFRLIVESGSFTSAAAQLNISDSTISSHMQDLEELLGVQLCERGRAGFRLTKSGEVVYDEILRLLQHVERFQANVGSLIGSMTGILNIGIADNMARFDGSPLHEAVKCFMARPNNRVILNIHSLNPREMEHGIITGGLHIALGPKHQQVAGLKYDYIFSEPNHLYCSNRHCLFKIADEDITQDTISSSAVIGRGYLSKFDYPFFGNIPHRANVYSMDAAIILIRSGHFIGFLPDHCAQTWVETGEMRAVLPNEFNFDARFHIITKKGVELDHSVLNLIQDIKFVHRDSDFGSKLKSGQVTSKTRAR